MLISSVAPAAAAAAAATDSCTNLLDIVAVVPLVRLAIVGSAITLPPERIMSPSELALPKSRGKTIRRSAGDGRNEVMFVIAPEVCSMAAGRGRLCAGSRRVEASWGCGILLHRAHCGFQIRANHRKKSLANSNMEYCCGRVRVDTARCSRVMSRSAGAPDQMPRSLDPSTALPHTPPNLQVRITFL